mgnify:CR=1 FL=1
MCLVVVCISSVTAANRGEVYGVCTACLERAYEGGGGYAVNLANGTQVYVDAWKCNVSGHFYDGASCVVYYENYASSDNIYSCDIYGATYTTYDDRIANMGGYVDPSYYAVDGWDYTVGGNGYVDPSYYDIDGWDFTVDDWDLLDDDDDGDFIFAFDDIRDALLIEEKIKLLRRYVNLKTKRVKFYTLCAYDRHGRYDTAFWRADVQGLLHRIDLLKRYDCLPYVMKFQEYKKSPFRFLYTSLANWCNQPHIFKKLDFIETVKRRNSKAYLALIQKQLEEF